ncbi:MAG: cytochrome b/b6 domain-containing protein [Phycisphaerales bacterium]|nr:MAG: cytochrome b/b6 domain-containing protein [Phycisphaerales bacterium]
MSILGILRRLVYLLALLCFVVLAITGFYPLLIQGKHISGYLMMVHATFAPVFAICLAVLTVMWASRCRLDKSDFPLIQRILKRFTNLNIPSEPIPKSSLLGQKIAFWLIVFLALPLILSIILSMFPLAGTCGQELLLATHRNVAIVFAVVAVIHTCLVVRAAKK